MNPIDYLPPRGWYRVIPPILQVYCWVWLESQASEGLLFSHLSFVCVIDRCSDCNWMHQLIELVFYLFCEFLEGALIEGLFSLQILHLLEQDLVILFQVCEPPF